MLNLSEFVISSLCKGHEKHCSYFVVYIYICTMEGCLEYVFSTKLSVILIGPLRIAVTNSLLGIFFDSEIIKW